MADCRVLSAVLRRHFPSFVRKVFEEVSQGDTLDWNWPLDAICWELESVRTGAGTRLIVTVPPRSLKSITISVAWVAFMLGHDPTLRFVCVSYSSELALKHARDCRRIMQSEWYRQVFSGAILSARRTAENDFETIPGGGRFSTSVGGTLTGRGGDIIVIDDPMKPDEAMSETARKGVIDWYSNTLISRLNDKRKGRIVLVMQRLHEGDLAGHLIETGDWRQLRLPAVAEERETIEIGPGLIHFRKPGDVLHPAREPLEVLESYRRAMGSQAFSAQYQQAPIPVEGNLVRPEWLRTYDRPPEQEPGDRIVQSWDTASKDGVLNDYSVCITALVRKREVFILDVFRGKLEFPALKKRVLEFGRRERINVLLIEDAASGTQLLQQLRYEKPVGIPPPIGRKPKADKVVRFSGETSRIEAGEVFLPIEAPWLAAFKRELIGFPGTKFDDQVDALAQLLEWMTRQPPRYQIGGFPVATGI